jgi:hypothetical protein
MRDRSAPGRVADRAALGVLVAITAGTVAAGYAAKKLLDALEARDRRRKRRGDEDAEGAER